MQSAVGFYRRPAPAGPIIHTLQDGQSEGARLKIALPRQNAQSADACALDMVRDTDVMLGLLRSPYRLIARALTHPPRADVIASIVALSEQDELFIRQDI